MGCLLCDQSSGKVWKIDRSSVKANPKVRAGDNYIISLDVKNVYWFGSYYGRACLYEGNTVIANSGSFNASKGETVALRFTGRMPNNALDLRVSISKEEWGFLDGCEDAVSIYIGLAAPGEDTEPPEDVEDKDEPPWYEDIMTWLEENTFIVMGFVVLLAIALIMRRK